MSRWSARQHALLGELGVRLWSPPANDAASTGRCAPGPDAVETTTAVPARAAAPLRRATEVQTQNWTRDDVAGMDWEALGATVRSCTACALSARRRNTVFGCGHPKAHWMIVGEAPGEQEDLRGEPFVGKSGQLLDSMLAALGLTRAAMPDAARQVYIANTVKCRPPGNRNPEPDELERCEPFLVRQIELVQPRVILAMGRFAVQTLLSSEAPLGRLRGSVHRYREVPLVVTYHPAYLLRNPQDKARAWEDLCLAREVAGRSAPAAQA
jgi:uracil-DNA glycosylase